MNASWQNFVDKWQQLSRSGLRLVDFEVALEGDSAPSMMDDPNMEAAAMMNVNESDEAGFGGGYGIGDFGIGGAAETMAEGAHAPAAGEGGGDLGQGFQVASMPASLSPVAANDAGAGFGGGSVD